MAATVLGSSMAFLDATVVNVALPTIGRELHTSLAGLQWIVTGYTLTLAGLILLGGSLGDRFGRRRVFLIGVIWFALASALCGLAPDIAVLIAARALQGIGGALLTPGSLAIIQSTFAPDDRPRAIGAWSGPGRRGRRDRPVPRRLDRRLDRLALDLPAQPAARRGGGRGDRAGTCRRAGTRTRTAGSTSPARCSPRWPWPGSPTR